MATVNAIVPGLHSGAYWMGQAAAFTADYPTTGRGGVGNTAPVALWEVMGLVAGTFEVVIDTISITAATAEVTLTELHADGNAVQVTMGTAHSLNIPMRDGFHITSTTAGCVVTFRIHMYI